MKNRFQNLIQLLKRLKNFKIIIQLGEEVRSETKAANIHIQQPVKPVDNIANYGFYRASICINPGQTAIIMNRELATLAIHVLDLNIPSIFKHPGTQIIKN